MKRKRKQGSKELENDRWPVASLTDDTLHRSRLQAQKDGTAVMDSEWLKIVGPCHRDTRSPASFRPEFAARGFVPRAKNRAR